MVRDMLTELYEALKKNEYLKKYSIKSFKRPEKLADKDPSIVIVPVTSPQQIVRGSNTSLAKLFLYQINCESTNRIEAKTMAREVEKTMESKGFYQSAGELDQYVEHIRRYVDARTYRGRSALYEDY